MASFRVFCVGLIGAGFFAVSSGAASAAESLASALSCPLKAGRSSLTLTVGDLERQVEVAVGPKAGRGGPAQVVFLWHGWGSNPGSLLDSLNLDKVWPQAVVIAPRGEMRTFPGLGSRSQPGWQLSQDEFDNRDIHLFDALVSEVLQRECLDRDRIVSSGFSNGAYFSNLLGCERASVLAAIAPVSGGGPTADCQNPVAVWVAHGRRDRAVSYRDGRSTFAAWRKTNVCEETETDLGGGCAEAEGCARPTVFCSFKGGHTWPRGLTQGWVRFLRQQRLPTPEIIEIETESETESETEPESGE